MMLDRILPFFSTDLFMPHGHCYLWKPELVGLHILSDALIALAYYSIPLTLSYFARRRRDLPFTWVFLLFSAFIVACGTTHLLEIWTLWHPTYWLSGVMKLITAVISLITAIVLVPIVPQALALPSPAQLEVANGALQQEIAERKRIEAELIRSRDLREAIFNESADALFLIDPQTLLTLDCNRRAVELFQAVDKASLIGIDGQTLQRDQFSQAELYDIGAEMWSKGVWSREIESVTCQGTVFWSSIAAKSLTVAEQAVNLVRVTDITERKQAELAGSRLAAIVESSSDAIIGKSLEGTITSWNASAEKLFGYTAAAAIGRPIAMLFPPDYAKELSQVLEQIQRGETIESYETVRVRQDGQRIEIAATISPIKDATGWVIGAANIAHDITARKQAEAALRDSERRFQAFMDNSPAAAWITDAAGRMLYMSQTYSRLFQVPNEVIGKTLFELYAPEIAEQFLRNIRRVIETDRSVEAIEVAPRTDGTLGEFLVYKFSLGELSGQRVVGGVAVDVTEQEQAKRALRSSNERLQYLLTNAPVVIFSCKVDGDYGATSMSENVRTLLGHEPQAFLEDSGFWATQIHPEERDRIFANMPQVFATGHHTHEYRFLHGDGDYHWVYVQLQLMRDEAGNPTEMIGYLIDISDRKQTETALRQSEVRNQALIQAIPDLLIRMKHDGTYLKIQKDGNVPLLNPKQMFAGNDIYAILPADKAQERMGHVQKALQTHALQVYEYQLRVDGKIRFEEARIVPCGEDEVLVIVRDISDRKQTEDFIKASLREKEVLLKEIHHRVKNNLGVVDGLLQMQSRRSQNAEVIEILKESQNRIASIALVHEKLYSSKDLAEIDFAHYIADLTAHLFDSYNIHAHQIKLVIQIDHVLLDIDTAIPCGLIINELVSNALKYAFANQQTGKIQVTLQQHQDQSLALIVQDNGMGLPQDFDLKQAKTLGMNLVKGLVKQLQGTLELTSKPGTTVKITFVRN